MDNDRRFERKPKHTSFTFVGINYLPEPLGVAPYATRLCSGMAQRNYDVRVITGVPHYPEWRVAPEYRRKWTTKELIDGVPVKRVRHFVPRQPSNLRRVIMEVTFGIRAALSGWGKSDVLICATPALLSTAIVCLRRLVSRNRPVLGIWVHDLYATGLSETQESTSTTARLAARLESWVLRQADAIAVLHDKFHQPLSDLEVDAARITTIRNWTHVRKLDVKDRRAFRENMGWSEDETVVLHAGNMGVKQGLDNVVRAAQLADDKELRIRFVLLGDGNQRSSLEAMAGTTHRLEFRDPLPSADFAAALKAADILLVNEKPGVSEMSIPSKLTSYFQSGRPVLAATDSASNAAYEIRNSGAGVVVDGGRPAQLLDAATTLGSDRRLMETLGAKGIQYVAAELSEEAALGKFDNWIGQLAARTASHRGRPKNEIAHNTEERK